MTIGKASASDFTGRFREIVADPINVLIARHESAGSISDGVVTLHNGNVVPVKGAGAYYGKFSDILVINRGVHEPLEEFVFQQVVNSLPQSPAMIELGAYWGHYSMWLKKVRPNGSVTLVEPDRGNLKAGKANFARNGYVGEFIRALVGRSGFQIDRYMTERSIQRLDILHSDIQGFEVEMVEGAADALRRKAIDYVFISTHSNQLHAKICEMLTEFGYRIEISSDYDNHTTSHDGLVFASSPSVPAVMNGFVPAGRGEIYDMNPKQLCALTNTYQQFL